MSMLDVYNAADHCLAQRSNRFITESVCPRCKSEFYYHGDAGAIKDEFGNILCEQCALSDLLHDYRVRDLCEALELEYIAAEDIDEAMAGMAGRREW